MNKNLKKVVLLSCTALLLLNLGTSCTHRLTDFTVISTKNVPIGTHSVSLKKADKRVKAKDTAHTILFIPLGMPNMKEAIDRAIESYPGAVGLVDGVVESSGWTCLLYGQSSYIVKGTPIYESDEIEIQTRPTQTVSNQSVYTSQPSSQITNNHSEDSQNFSMLFFHEIKKGDTLDSIAESYNVSIGDIITWNQLSSSTLVPGEKLRIILKR